MSATVIPLRPARLSCDYDDADAVAVIRWADGEAHVCEPHRSLVQGQAGVDVLPLEAAQP